MNRERRLPDHFATIPDALGYWAEETPDAPALRASDGRKLSHGELYQTMDRVSRRLAARAVAREERVALVLPAGFDLAIILLGTVAAATAAPLNPASSASELTRDLERLRPKLVVTGGPPQASMWDIAARLRSLC